MTYCTGLPQSHRPHMAQKEDNSACAAVRLTIRSRARCGANGYLSRIETPLQRPKKFRIGPISSLRQSLGFLNSGLVAKNTNSNSFEAAICGCASIGFPSIGPGLLVFLLEGSLQLRTRISKRQTFHVVNNGTLSASGSQAKRGYVGSVQTDCLRHDDYCSADFIGPMVAA